MFGFHLLPISCPSPYKKWANQYVGQIIDLQKRWVKDGLDVSCVSSLLDNTKSAS
jgi:hypothetical protein